MNLELALTESLLRNSYVKSSSKSRGSDLKRRRGIITWSLVDMAGMTAVTLLQTRIIKHLPDPPFGNVDSDRVNSSDTAYRLGVPDGSLSLASLAANIPIAAFGGAERVQTRPWVPLVAALKATGEALAASWYFYQMPAKGKAWCGYCIVGALANIGIAALTLPEARKALAVIMSETQEPSDRV